MVAHIGIGVMSVLENTTGKDGKSGLLIAFLS